MFLSRSSTIFPDFSGRLVEGHFAVVGHLMDLSGHVLGDSGLHEPANPPPQFSRLGEAAKQPCCNSCARLALLFFPLGLTRRHETFYAP